MGTASDKPRQSMNESSPFSQVLDDTEEIKLELGGSVSSYLSESGEVQPKMKNESGSKEMLNVLAAVSKPLGSGDSGIITLNQANPDDKVDQHGEEHVSTTAKKNIHLNLDLKAREDIDDTNNNNNQDYSQMAKDEIPSAEIARKYELEYKKISGISFEKDNTHLKCDIEKPEDTSFNVFNLDRDNMPSTSRYCTSALESKLKEPSNVRTGQSQDSKEEDTVGITPEFSAIFGSRYSFQDPLSILQDDDTQFELIGHGNAPLNTVFESVLEEPSVDKPLGEEPIHKASTQSGTTLKDSSDEDVPVSAIPLPNGEPEPSKDTLHSESNGSQNSDEPGVKQTSTEQLSPSVNSSKSTLPETCVHASEFNLSPTKRSPNLETTPEDHYYNNQFVDPNRFESIYSTETAGENDFYEEQQLDSYWNEVNSEIRSYNQKGNGMETFKQQLQNLQVSLNKTRIGVDFKLKTIISDLRTDFDYWHALVSGALETIQTMTSVEEEREMASPVFSDVSYEEWPAAGGEKGASSGAPVSTKHHEGSPQNTDNSNGGPIYAVPIPTAQYNYGLTGPAGYNRMTLPNRMHYSPYYGYVPRPKYQAQHQPAFMFGPNMRGPPSHHQFPSPTHGGMHYAGRSMPPPKSSSMPKSSHPGGGPFFPNRSNGDMGAPTAAMGAPPTHYSSGGGTPFPPNRSNSRPAPPSSQSAPPPSNGNSYCGGPPFPKRSHATTPSAGRPSGNAPVVQKVATGTSQKETDEDSASAKSKFAAKEKPKKKSNNRKRVTSKPNQGKILP